MYEDGFNIEEWKAKKLAERQETFAAQEEALKDVFVSGQTLANYFYQRGRLGSHITAGNTALILRAHPLACAVMSADDWSKYGRRVSKGCTGIAQIVRSNGYYAVAKVFDISQTYGNKPYPIAAVESTKQIEKVIDVMREISPIPVLPKNEVEGFCYDAERQELVFCAAMPPQELLQRLPADRDGSCRIRLCRYLGKRVAAPDRRCSGSRSLRTAGFADAAGCISNAGGHERTHPRWRGTQSSGKSAGNGGHLWGCRVQAPETGARSACSAAGRTVMPNALQPHR